MTQVHPKTLDINDISGGQCPSPCKKSTIGQFLYNTITNAAYNIKHNNLINIPFLQRQKVCLGGKSQNVYFLGKRFYQGEEEKLQNQFQNTVWFSYRKNIKGIGNDSGWGCMIRVTQMLLAHVLRKTLSIGPNQIIEYFRENQNNSFSLINICKQGSLKRQWYGSSKVVFTCKEILQQNPLFNLKIVSNSIGLINYNEIQAHLLTQNKSVLLSLHCQLGIQKIDEQLLPYLKSLMTFPQFSGCLGGTPGSALYLLGYQKDLIICLDPHYVQQASTGDQTYFKTHPRGIHYNKLVGSICINFLIENSQRLDSFILRLLDLNKKNDSRQLLSIEMSQKSKSLLDLNQSYFESDDQQIVDSDEQDYQIIC